MSVRRREWDPSDLIVVAWGFRTDSARQEYLASAPDAEEIRILERWYVVHPKNKDWGLTTQDAFKRFEDSPLVVRSFDIKEAPYDAYLVCIVREGAHRYSLNRFLSSEAFVLDCYVKWSRTDGGEIITTELPQDVQDPGSFGPYAIVSGRGVLFLVMWEFGPSGAVIGCTTWALLLECARLEGKKRLGPPQFRWSIERFSAPSDDPGVIPGLEGLFAPAWKRQFRRARDRYWRYCSSYPRDLEAQVWQNSIAREHAWLSGKESSDRRMVYAMRVWQRLAEIFGQGKSVPVAAIQPNALPPDQYVKWLQSRSFDEGLASVQRASQLKLFVDLHFSDALDTVDYVFHQLLDAYPASDARKQELWQMWVGFVRLQYRLKPAGSEQDRADT